MWNPGKVSERRHFKQGARKLVEPTILRKTTDRKNKGKEGGEVGIVGSACRVAHPVLAHQYS